jgi:hypothetical protein
MQQFSAAAATLFAALFLLLHHVAERLRAGFCLRWLFLQLG